MDGNGAPCFLDLIACRIPAVTHAASVTSALLSLLLMLIICFYCYHHIHLRKLIAAFLFAMVVFFAYFCCLLFQRSGYEVYLLEATYKDPAVS